MFICLNEINKASGTSKIVNDVNDIRDDCFYIYDGDAFEKFLNGKGDFPVFVEYETFGDAFKGGMLKLMNVNTNTILADGENVNNNLYMGGLK